MRTLFAFAAIVGLAAASYLTADAKFGPLDNGKAIFQTGTDLSGKTIVATKRSLMPSCAACHKADGSGGLKLPGGAVSADLRHKSLVSGKHPYTTALIARAITSGVDNEGKKLDPAMPRWKLSSRDLHDVVLYVQSLK
ncbi:MAG: c-type cytochrome [Candidatus Eremiobacteraeota bacterium]|nr:c-type cytochrome [Candidatus Eremiobacteraeota bacterium]